MTHEFRSGPVTGARNFVMELLPQLCKTLMAWSCLFCLLISPPDTIASQAGYPDLKDGLYAEIKTDQGIILLELYSSMRQKYYSPGHLLPDIPILLSPLPRYCQKHHKPKIAPKFDSAMKAVST